MQCTTQKANKYNILRCHLDGHSTCSLCMKYVKSKVYRRSCAENDWSPHQINLEVQPYPFCSSPLRFTIGQAAGRHTTQHLLQTFNLHIMWIWCVLWSSYETTCMNEIFKVIAINKFYFCCFSSTSTYSPLLHCKFSFLFYYWIWDNILTRKPSSLTHHHMESVRSNIFSHCSSNSLPTFCFF